MFEFDKGQRVPIAGGGDAIVLSTMGFGGNGCVYRVLYNGREYALKWYNTSSNYNTDKFYANICANVKKGFPNKLMLWPLFVTERLNKSYGYLMDVCPENYKPLTNFILGKEKFKSLSAMINSAFNLLSVIREMHSRRLRYLDFHENFVLIDPSTGDIRMTDADTIAVFGQKFGIAQKCRYMAPELVLGEKEPDIQTERHSLAVVLFLLLFGQHPLEGRKVLVSCLTDDKERKFFGSEPVFIYDPLDNTNRPVNGIHKSVIQRWAMFPSYVLDLFVKAFSKERLKGQKPRITEHEWLEMFIRLSDSVICCPQCGTETFVTAGKDSSCINCAVTIPKLPYLKIGRYEAVMYPGKKLYQCHIDPDSDHFSREVAVVLRNPQKPTIWGLRNLSNESWRYENKEGEEKILAPNDVVVLLRIKTIRFDKTCGTMLY